MTAGAAPTMRMEKEKTPQAESRQGDTCRLKKFILCAGDITFLKQLQDMMCTASEVR